MHPRLNERRTESGFALILAIVALVLLTFLGLTLTLSTSSETQVASNYKWSRQAYYNAVAGAEVGRSLLKRVPTNWDSVLPPKRSLTEIQDTTNPPALPPSRGGTANSRDWEGRSCDRPVTTYSRGNIGYGSVLTVGASAVPAVAPAVTLDYVTTFQNQALNGAFTVWVRRVTAWDQTNNVTMDCGPAMPSCTQPQRDGNELVMTVEGVAPYKNTSLTNAASGAVDALRQDQAVQVIQMNVISSNATLAACGSYGQSGGGATGSNFSACSTITAGGVPGTASTLDSGVQ